MFVKKYLPLLTFCASLPVLAADIESNTEKYNLSYYDTSFKTTATQKLTIFRNTLESAYGHLLSDETVDWRHLPQSHIETLWNETGEQSFKNVLEELMKLRVGDTHEKSEDLYDFLNQKLDSTEIMKKMDDFKEKLGELELSLNVI
jgi:hypothetical protein